MNRAAVSSALLLLAAIHLQAQVPAGGEFQVNTYTTQSQESPAGAVGRGGDFIVAWASWGQDGEGTGVFAQRYDAAGPRRGGEFQVNTYTRGLQSYRQRHDVAVDSEGNFVVVWSSEPELNGSLRGVFGRRFDAAGNPLASEFHVNTFTPYQQAQPRKGPRVAMAPAGSFVVVWDSVAQDGDNYGVFARRYDAAGTPISGEIQVNTYTTGRQLGANIDMDAAGNFVVVWNSDRPVPSGFDVFGQRFDSSGNRIGGEFQINTYTTGNQGYLNEFDPKVAMAEDGRFVVIWYDTHQSPRARGQRFDAAGARAGGEFSVNSPSGYGAMGLASDARGNFVVAWQDPDGWYGGIFARRFDASGAARGNAFRVNTYTTHQQYFPWVGADEVGNFVVAWHSHSQEDNNYYGVFAQRYGGLRPQALAVDSAGNRVLDPGETAVVQPTWRNINGASQTFGGALSNLNGPAGPTYTLADGTGAYGTVANAASAACTDCYAVQVSGTRPAVHWDASAVETITPDTLGQQKQWVLHVGGSFTDVSSASPFYRFIETLLHHGITAGCAATQYCPASSTSRDQMAVFVLVAKEGLGYAPPACVTPTFADVPASSPFCPWIEELARRGVVSGCGGGNYCPATPVGRDQMAVFVLRTVEPTLNPPACTTPMFNDVPAGSTFCPWIEELARRGVVSGCGGGNYCPGTGVTREQMGVFLSVTFGLTLYGP